MSSDGVCLNECTASVSITADAQAISLRNKLQFGRIKFPKCLICIFSTTIADLEAHAQSMCTLPLLPLSQHKCVRVLSGIAEFEQLMCPLQDYVILYHVTESYKGPIRQLS
jgi:hypothetical protein